MQVTVSVNLADNLTVKAGSVGREGERVAW